MKHLTATLFFICMLFGVALSANAQVTVSGNVTDAETGAVIPGANIFVKGMPSRGTATNRNGEYSLVVPSSQDTLVFSFIGYLEKEIPVAGRNTINVTLVPNVEQLENLVVIGYGTTEREDKTGSIVSIGPADFNEGAITSVSELFKGKAAGVTVTSNGGAPGGGAVIRIRGGSSLSASNAPLYVVDGVPLEGGGVAGTRNPLSIINPNDIASITVLKDASAAAIYGSRASNGVIIITTKRGYAGQGLEVNYSGTFSYHTKTEQVDVLSAAEFRDVVEQQFGTAATDLLGDANTNWQDHIYENNYSQQHNISVAGAIGSLNLPFRASFGFSGNNGILKTSEINRITGSIALNPRFFDGDLRVDLNLKGMRVNNNFANRGAIGSAVTFDPTQPVTVDGSDTFGGYFTWTDNSGNPVQIAPANPVALLKQTNDHSMVYRSIGNVKFDYSLPFISNMSATLNLGYDYSKVGNGTNNVTAKAAFAYVGPNEGNGSRTTYTQRKQNEILDFYLKYNGDLPSINSALEITAGYAWEHHYQQGTNYSTNFNIDDILVVNSDTDYETEFYIVSFFGRVNYSLNDKYLLTATLRQDGTSRFSPENRWGLFPSLALAWKIDEEPFLQDAESLSQLKLRVSYGVTGQQRIGQGNYPYLPRYTLSEPTARYPFGGEFIYTLRPEGYNENLKWEETTTYNLGLDYGFLNNRIFGSIDVYYRETTDLLNVIPVPAGTNFTNRILTNVGNLESKGIEFAITGRIITHEDYYWQAGFNIAHNVNEITKLTTVTSEDYIGVEVGGISGGVGNTVQINSVGYPRNSFYVYEQVYDENGNPIEGVYVDRNGDGTINQDDKYRYKDPSPDFTMGFSSRFEYKKWDASFSAHANVGNYIYNNVMSNNTVYSFMYNSAGYLINTLSAIKNVQFNRQQYWSDHYIENASFLRMDYISVGYTFNDFINRGTTMRLSGTVQNVFVITNYSGLDPEVFGGIDNNIYPRPRSFVLGLSLNF